MSVVSSQLDTTFLMKRKRNGKAVQFQPAELDYVAPPPYFVNPAGELIQIHHRSYTKNSAKPDLNTATHGTAVPLKCDQYGTHAGNSLFYADTPAMTEPLKIELEYAGIKLDHHATMVEEHQHTPPLDYYNLYQGLRASPRQIIENQPTTEPAGMSFRPEHLAKRSKLVGVNYNIGFYGLNHP